MMETASSRLKSGGTIRVVISAQFKNLHLWWFGGGLVLMEVATCTSGKALSMQILDRHMLPSRQCVFQGKSCRFQQDRPQPHTVAIPRAWLCSRRVQVLDWPACSQIWKHLEQLNPSIRQEWDNIPLSKAAQWVASVPRCLQTVI